MFICVRSVAKVIFAQFKLIGKKKSDMYNYKYYIFAYIVCVCVGGGGWWGRGRVGRVGRGVVTVPHVKVLLFVYMEVFVHKFCKNDFCMTPAHQRKKKKLLFLISVLTALQINRYVVYLKCVL